MELRSQARPRATSEGRTQLGIDRLDQQITTFVNSPSLATGVTRDGKETSRLLPQRVVSSGPSPHNPIVRVREELTHHPMGTRPVAEGHVGKAATGTGGLRPIVSLN